MEAPCKTINILSFEGNDKESSGIQEIEFNLVKGYSIYDTNSSFSGIDWFSDKFELRKDMKTIYTEKENDEYWYPFRSRKFADELPRIATKGNLTAFITEATLKPNGTFYKAYLFKDDKFIKTVKVNKTIIINDNELKELFEKEF